MPFNYQFKPVFLPLRSARRHSCILGLPNIGHRREFGEVSCTERTGQGNDFKLIPTTKMETRHPVEGSFGNEFLSIYNQFKVMDA